MAVMYRDPSAPSADGYDVRHRDDLVQGDDPWWAHAEPIAWGPPASQTTFRAAWTADALLARFEAVDAHPWHTIAERDGALWNEEVVELFLDPDGSGRNYAEFEVNPAGTICDLVVRTPWPSLLSDRSWNCVGVTACVTMVGGVDAAPRGWTVELVIPWGGLATLGPHAAQRTPPRRGDCWRFNVFRIDRPHGPVDPERDAVYAAWSVPAGPSFHDTNAFRDLRFR